MKLPTKKDWCSFLNFMKKTQIDLIINSTDFDKQVERSQKNIIKTEQYIKDNIKLSEKLDKSINNEPCN